MSTATPNLEEIWKLFHETSRRFQETDRRFQETDRKFQETDRRFQETDKKFQETDQMIDRLGHKWDKQWGRFGNRLGEFVASMVAPAAVRLFQERNIEVHQLYRELEGERDGIRLEADLVVANDQDIVVIEVKSKLSVEDVNDHLTRLEKFRLIFHRFADARLMGAVAAMVIPEEVGKYAYRQGLFVIGQTGEVVKILNDTQFVPRIW